MAHTPTTTIDLASLSLSHGEGKRLDLPVRFEPLQLGGQTYEAEPESPRIRLEVSRPIGGFAFHLRFPLHLEGPCMRCLDPASTDLEVEAREIDQHDTEDEELRSPYVVDDELDVGRWAHDTAALAVPARFLCRPDCAGLCPVCGESLNDSGPHKHETPPDPRWDKLRDLKVD